LKKTIAIFFLSLYLFSATEAQQLLKLPIVFMHFYEHQQEDKNISFLAFLDMHYMHGSPMDDDYDRDMQLPFKTACTCITSVLPATVPEMGVVLSPPQIFVLQNDFLNRDEMMIPFDSFCNVFQPPRC
jgi:hypothetical protein